MSQQKDTSASPSSGGGLILVSFAPFLFIAFIVVAIFGYAGYSITQPETMAYNVVKEELKSPDTAKEVHSQIVASGDWNNDGNKEYIIHTVIDAKNGFNATVRSGYLVWIEKTGIFAHRFRNSVPYKFSKASQEIYSSEVNAYAELIGVDGRMPASEK